jgi:predicted DNA repair protein MutK
MPKLLAWLSAIGTAAMLWVGGHILLAGTDELGWTGPYHLVHNLEGLVADVPAIGGVLSWVVNTAVSALVGLIVGGAIVLIVARIPKRQQPDTQGTAGPATAH